VGFDRRAAVDHPAVRDAQLDVGDVRAEGTAYRGFLFAGLMLTCDGPKVIEFNVRFGDPEAQVVMPLIESELHSLVSAAADGALDERAEVVLKPRVSVGVVLASAGYPGDVSTGQPIEGVDEAAAVPDVSIYHAGTAMKDNELVTAGGRVLTVVALGNDYQEARARAYEAAGRIHFDGIQYRRDIGLKAISNSQPPT
ncbi:MAG TPA: phosphoribosylglycinamide synthetase C domain-containing protein, partial [Vicinamibacterales bacterium]|nr:phosphoribosylglycinamide synthetase C domain-containing protein [Vicinamibacterales bacterium]